MDLANQEAILRIAKETGTDGLVVVLGALETESIETLAETVTAGDPSYAGAMAGASLGLPVYHILEPTVREAIPQEVYDDKLGVLAFEDGEPFGEALEALRARTSPSDK